MHADIGPETARVTTLGSLRAGQRVNLERAMRADSRFGGHFVQGHVDGTGTVRQVRPEGDAHWLTIAFAEELAPYLIRKGSIAVDGVSLTIAELRRRGVRRDDHPVHVGAHEPLDACPGQPREPRMRHGREIRGVRNWAG